jgi:hypothetical protein
MRWYMAVSLLCSAGGSVVAGPVVFWAPDQLIPGDVVLLYGGDLRGAKQVHLARLRDGNPGQPAAAVPDRPPGEAIIATVAKASESAVTFRLPETLKAGLFAVQVETPAGRSPVRVLNRPEVWFLQPTTLRPGLGVNQAPPGAGIQIIGKNFTLRGDAPVKPRAILRSAGKGRSLNLGVSRPEPFSLLAHIPEGAAPGHYELLVHNGYGGPLGWSAPLAVEIKSGDAWPQTVFNVRQFGARGDDVSDDTTAVRDALAAADKNGGGIVNFPWGTYRLNDWLLIPERTTLRGEIRNATVLKWPLTPPLSEKDFQRAAIFMGPRCALENLTLVARKVENILLDVQVELNNARTVPPEVIARVRPWGQGGDIFLRRLTVHHLLLAGRPEQQKPVMENAALNKRYWEGLRNVNLHEGHNCEVSDCSFEGGDQQFGNLVNGRIVRNSFANHMGYCWTALGGGAKDVVCEGNDIQASSSWGWGWVGMQRVYSAHNVSHNFVRGEREAMTVDNSALATARPVSQYWGTPIESGVEQDRPFLRFPSAKEVSLDGFRTGWTPGCFKGGTVILYPAPGSPGSPQTRKVIDNTDDTVFLDKPFTLAPDTTPRRRHIEIAPRHSRAHIGTTAWLGTLVKSEPTAFTAKDANWVPQEFVGMTALILDGRGAGQYRVITTNTTDGATLDRPWDVTPDQTSMIGIWSLMRHMVIYDCRGYDTSAFAQMYGPFYDYIVDNCQVERTQGIWGQCGWFTQTRDNTISYAHTYHSGIGMRGPNPEKNAPFGYTGLDNHRLRITKSGALQYPDRKMPVFVDEVIGRLIPSTLVHIQRRNGLRYGQRLVMQPWADDKPPGPRPGGGLFRDVVMDANTIENTPVGIQIGPNVEGVILARNQFRDVERPTWLAKPDNVLTLPSTEEGIDLFAKGDLSGWIEEQHEFFRKKHPDAATWSVKDGVVICDGSLGNCGFLRYDRKLSDFTLRLEYRVSAGCNSGVCIRVPAAYNGKPDETLPSKFGYEVQILDDAGEEPSTTSTGALYGLVAPRENAARPAGEWSTLEIACHGPRIRVTVNGRVVQDLNQPTVEAIKNRPRDGYLLLQNHGHGIEFRNVRLKDESTIHDAR